MKKVKTFLGEHKLMLAMLFAMMFTLMGFIRREAPLEPVLLLIIICFGAFALILGFTSIWLSERAKRQASKEVK